LEVIEVDRAARPLELLVCIRKAPEQLIEERARAPGVALIAAGCVAPATDRGAGERWQPRAVVAAAALLGVGAPQHRAEAVGSVRRHEIHSRLPLPRQEPPERERECPLAHARGEALVEDLELRIESCQQG